MIMVKYFMVNCVCVSFAFQFILAVDNDLCLISCSCCCCYTLRLHCSLCLASCSCNSNLSMKWLGLLLLITITFIHCVFRLCSALSGFLFFVLTFSNYSVTILCLVWMRKLWHLVQVWKWTVAVRSRCGANDTPSSYCCLVFSGIAQ